MKFKILLIPSCEKLPSFKVMVCSVLEFRAIYWAGGGKHTPPHPGAYRVNMSTLVDLVDMIEKPEGVHHINTKLFSISLSTRTCSGVNKL